MPITALYAALLTLLFLLLSFRTIGARRTAKVEIGDGDDRELLRRMRVHANFAEYVPIALVLMGMAESMDLPAWALHPIGAVLLLGRIGHAYALSQTPHIMQLRVIGMAATFSAIISAALACLLLSLRALT